MAAFFRTTKFPLSTPLSHMLSIRRAVKPSPYSEDLSAKGHVIIRSPIGFLATVPWVTVRVINDEEK